MLENMAEKLFCKNKTPDEQESRSAFGKLSSVVGVVCNVLLFAAKLAVGQIFGSVSITADALNNLSDAGSSTISLFGFRLAEKPADEEHPYGHGRYEYLSALFVAVLIMLIGVELLKGSVEKIIDPVKVEFSWLTIAVLIGSMLVKLWIMVFNRRAGNKIGSQALIAASNDSRNDVIATGAVLAASLISHFTSVELDGWMGAAVAVFILVSGFGMMRDTLNPLLGDAPDKAYVKSIRDKILSYKGVSGTHDLMIHDYGPGRKFASVHVEMSSDIDVFESHDVIDNIEADFKEEGLHLIVHYDPIDTRNTALGEFRHWLSENIKIIDPELTVHDLRMVPGTTHTNVIFDCVMPYSLEMTDGELKAAVSTLVKTKYPDYRSVITIDRSYAALPH